MEGTGALRGAAARWSLAGDQQLLDLLQEIHQRIITRCNETNSRLEEMSRGLRDASVNLQNVNNKFLALSNTQFVESRVYEDDTDVVPPAAEKEPPKATELSSDLSKLKASLQTLEGFHEPLLIARDSGSDTDSDESVDRLVLKPKDLYADRPLPYVIGSQAWRGKWHAGLVPDDSDSDSSTSKVEEVEQYSDSEEEKATTRDFVPVRKVSSSSSSPRPPAPASPAAVAAALARRLGGDHKIPEREPVYTQPETVARKLYKPQEPLATTVFPDEPPPLDEPSSDDDVFAELHRAAPREPRTAGADLFHFHNEPSALEDALFGPPKVQTSQSVEKPPLFSEYSEPEVAATPKTAAKEHSDDSVKKPIGGISLFGTNKHAESIGAAILKRNRRKSSTSGDESNTEEVVKEVKPDKEVQEVKKERDIFDDLFAKSEKLNNKNAKSKVVEPRADIKPKDKKKDIFSDIFDDIDDIFSSDIVNVPVKETKDNEKSLFSDDDDLFAEISNVKKDNRKEKVVASEKSSLFGDVTPKVQKNKSNEKSDIFTGDKPNISNIKKENKAVKEIKETKSLFDSDSDDGLFANVSKDVKQDIRKTKKPVENKIKDNLFDDDGDDGLFEKNITKQKVDDINISKATDKEVLFDSDDELFNDAKINKVNPDSVTKNTVAIPSTNDNNDRLSVKPVNEPVKNTEKHDIVYLGDNESNLLNSKQANNPTVIDSINNDFFNEAPPPIFAEEQTPEVSHDSFDDEVTNLPITCKNNAKEAIVSEDSQNNESIKDISDDVFGKPSEQTHFSENVLRTTRIASDDEKLSTEPPNQPDMFNDSDDDLFRSKPKILGKNVNQKDIAPKPTTSELFTKPSDNNDIFSDIFDDVPPDFEIPKEPKKSKNVNALFDDDSDDEALFFKKNDIITDEKPNFSPSEERFGIFNDEPPAIDFDFTQKPNKKGEFIQHSPNAVDLPPNLDIPDDFLPEPVKSDNVIGKLIEKTDALRQESEDATDNTINESKKIGKLKPMNININVSSLLPGASPKKKQIENIEVKQDQTASNEELHNTVKIEPKMVKSISFDDPEILDNKMSKQRAKIQVKRRPSTRRARREAVRKSAIDFTDSSFDSSNDNSTKDEVKEKIVKTVYILNDDDIFGTTKTSDESTVHTRKHLNIVDSDEELFKKPDNLFIQSPKHERNDAQQTTETKSSLQNDDIDDIFKESSNPTEKVEDEVDTKPNKVLSQQRTKSVDKWNVKDLEEIKNVVVRNQSEKKSFLDSDEDDLFKQTDKKPPKGNVITEPELDSDEKLFKNTKTNIQKVKDTKSFLFSDGDDELFKTKNPAEIKPVLKSNISSDEEDLFKNKGIGTLGKVYNKGETAIKEKHNIFEDFPAKLDRGDISSTPEVVQSKANTTKQPVEIKTVKDVEKPVKKSILDDLSDEDDLFKSKPKLVNRKHTSLFGDDEDGDDLFGTKTVKEVKPEVPVALPVKETKAAETVFVDPLSLFGDDD